MQIIKAEYLGLLSSYEYFCCVLKRQKKWKWETEKKEEEKLFGKFNGKVQ